MTIEVLVATMNQEDYSLVERMGINSPAIVVNQCNRNSVVELINNGSRILWIDTIQKGLSKSRNMALSFATGDICLLADDDEVLLDGYTEIIKTAFNEKTHADIVSFNIERINQRSRRKANKDRKAPYYKYYPSVSLAFRRLRIVKNGIHFNDLIGAGTQYGSGEEAIFLMESRKKNLKVYENSKAICTVDFSTSSWFSGYTERYYRNIGVFLAAAYGKKAKMFGLYYLIQSRKTSELSASAVWGNIKQGISHFYDM